MTIIIIDYYYYYYYYYISTYIQKQLENVKNYPDADANTDNNVDLDAD